MDTGREKIQHVFLIGSKSIGQYGGYETFVDKLTEQHRNDASLQYHVACKANGDGCMDESRLNGVEVLKTGEDGKVKEFLYHNAHVFKIPCPNIGPAVAIYYDCAALDYTIRYCRDNHISHPYVYILTCRIGPFMERYRKQIEQLGGRVFLNPDGHEWMRAKWSAPVRAYWKWSERLMVKHADTVVCDSVTIKKYIEEEYRGYHPSTRYIAYGAETERSRLADDDPCFLNWLSEKGLQVGEYYLVVGRFVPENNYETMIREFMRSHTKHSFALITNVNEKFLAALEAKLHFSQDSRIKFVGTVYDAALLKKIRECAYGYFHGHEVGGTNPSLLEALGSTELNLLLDVGFNREVGQEAALYWSKAEGELASLIDRADTLSKQERKDLGEKAKDRIRSAYSWAFIGDEYRKLWRETE